MSILRVDTAARTLQFDDKIIPCNIGRSGACPADKKSEGDGCTPLGTWVIRSALFRPGKVAPPDGFALPWRWIGNNDGWCDDPGDPAYNRPVRLPHPASAEALIHDDDAYDIILPLGYNDEPPQQGKGSAIFFHLFSPRDYTQGCVAISREDMDWILPKLTPGDVIEIV